MSLSSFLLSKATEAVDTELDDLFKAAPKPAATATTKTTTQNVKGTSSTNANAKQKKLKRKPATSDSDSDSEAGPSTAPAKRQKSDTQPTPSKSTSRAASKAGKEKAKDSSSASQKQSKTSSKQKKKAPTPPSGSDSEEEEGDNSDIENRYLAQRAKKQQQRQGKGKESEDEEDVDEEEKEERESEDVEVDDEDEGAESAASESESSSDEGEEDPPVHESLLKNQQNKKTGKNSKRKYVPEDETPEMRDRRTIFVGNLPMLLAQKRPLQKQLQRHILSFVPSAKIESIRFRSVPFQNPTSKLPGSDDEDSAPSKTKRPASQPSEKPTNHSTNRAQSWRTTSKDDDEDAVKKDEKSYLTPHQKKKIAFINQQFHSTADTVNCYIVFAHSVPTQHQGKNVPPPPPVMDPYEAARIAVEKGNNTVFMERVVRVDRVGLTSKKASGGVVAEGVDGEVGAQGDADPKYTIFVGNLDFASKEEDVRVFFEGLVVKEKGAPPVAEDGMDVDGESKKASSWVVRVRIVRDKETQLGKGFAYVQFSDKECVDEILALEESKLKFAKRKLRVQRCKTIPGTSFKIKSTPASSKSSSSTKSQPGAPTSSTKKPFKNAAPTPIIVPKGDPTLGDRLAHLPKAVRKDVKRNDGDRVARRLAKKKARMAMGPPKAAGTGGSNEGVRDRKRTAGAKGEKGGNSGKKSGNKRVRSDKMAAKRNGKK
ncbi:hypothetical protein EST38_g9328 [Candolleomyces aberdarensis]|uniref:Nucleolar protein 12 n=1 Tax=Candolleomyces aberdarensis TaxID=2316362 RepID=A0A4Q2DCE9_9AGAR|nr:hypothetical protein EST38_g9328 [Candolleomyces aberdarensis]